MNVGEKRISLLGRTNRLFSLFNMQEGLFRLQILMKARRKNFWVTAPRNMKCAASLRRLCSLFAIYLHSENMAVVPYLNKLQEILHVYLQSFLPLKEFLQPQSRIWIGRSRWRTSFCRWGMSTCDFFFYFFFLAFCKNINSIIVEYNSNVRLISLEFQKQEFSFRLFSIILIPHRERTWIPKGYAFLTNFLMFLFNYNYSTNITKRFTKQLMWPLIAEQYHNFIFKEKNIN